MSGVTSQESSPSTNEDLSVFKPVYNNTADLLDLLYDFCSKWRYFGEKLDLSASKLEIIRCNQPETESRMHTVLGEAIKQNGPIKASTISKILRGNVIQAYYLADRFDRVSKAAGASITKINVMHCIKPDISDTVFPYTRLKTKLPVFVHGLFVFYIIMQVFTVIDDGAPFSLVN